jgi:hypothetical protein
MWPLLLLGGWFFGRDLFGGSASAPSASPPPAPALPPPSLPPRAPPAPPPRAPAPSAPPPRAPAPSSPSAPPPRAPAPSSPSAPPPRAPAPSSPSAPPKVRDRQRLDAAKVLAEAVVKQLRAKGRSYDRTLMKRFQATAGLAADGLYGPRSAGAVAWYTGQKIAPLVGKGFAPYAPTF